MAKETKARVRLINCWKKLNGDLKHEGGPVNIQLEAGPEHRRADLEINYGK